MASERRVSYDIAANPSEFKTGVAEAVSAAKEGAEAIKAAFEAITAPLEALSDSFIGFMGLLAGGEALKEFIETSSRLGFESEELGKRLGIGATAASQLKVALDSTFISQDIYESAVSHLTRTLATNEKAFTDQGIATRDSSGHFRDMLDIILDVNTHLESLRAGTDRNVAAARLYGKGWKDSADILRLTREAMEEAKERADALGLTIGVESIERSLAYKRSMVEVLDVLEAVSKAIGDVILPALTALGNWFGSIGPGVVAVFRGAMELVADVASSAWDVIKDVFAGLVDVASGLVDALATVLGAIKQLFVTLVGLFSDAAQAIIEVFGLNGPGITWGEFFVNVLRVVVVAAQAFSASIITIFETIAAATEFVIDAFRLLASVIEAALTLDWSKIKSAWDGGLQQLEDNVNKHVGRVAAAINKLDQDATNTLTKDFGAPKKETPNKPSGGGAPAPGAEDKNVLSQLEAELEHKKALYARDNAEHEQFLEFSKQAELDYWKNVLETTSLGSENKLKVKEKIWKLELDIAKQGFENELADLREREKAAGAHYDERLRLAQEYAAKVGTAYGLDSQQYKKAQQDVIAVDEQRKKQLREIGDLQEKAAAQIAELGIENEERAAQMRVQLGTESKQQLLQQEVAFENQKYQIKVQALQRELALERQTTDDPAKIARINTELEVLERQHQNNITQIQRTAQLERDKYWKQGADLIASSFTHAVASMLNGTRTFTGAVRGLFGELGDGLINIFAKMAEEWIAKEILKLIASKTTGEGIVAQQAGVAGASGTASWAGAPWPIDLGAPGFGAAMAAAAGSFAVAEEGFDIPSGINPMVQAHAREMVLPAPLADVIRGLAGGTTYGPTHVENHFYRPMVSTDHIVGHITKAMRNGHPAFNRRS